METTKFIWQNGKFIPWEEAKVHVLTHGLHYGSSVFEGIRCYKTNNGSAVYALDQHIDRLFYSAGALRMEVPFSKKEITDATLELIRKNKVEECYIRPILFYGYGKMGLNPRGALVDAVIACWPWGKYLPHDMVDIKISKYIRIHPQSGITDAKISGHYVNSIMASIEVWDSPYHEALFLDYEGFIAEGPGENFFMVKNNELITPKTGRILAGITRRTVMELAPMLGMKVTEAEMRKEDILTADEAFFTGTAAEITPIRSVDDKSIGTGKIGPSTERIKAEYAKIVRGENKGFLRHLAFV